jgi:hypothetical protein
MSLTLKMFKFLFEINMLKFCMIWKTLMMVYINYNLTNVSTVFNVALYYSVIILYKEHNFISKCCSKILNEVTIRKVRSK